MNRVPMMSSALMELRLKHYLKLHGDRDSIPAFWQDLRGTWS